MLRNHAEDVSLPVTLKTGEVSLLADSTYIPCDSLNILFDSIRIGDTVSLSANPNKQTNKQMNK